MAEYRQIPRDPTKGRERVKLFIYPLGTPKGKEKAIEVAEYYDDIRHNRVPAYPHWLTEVPPHPPREMIELAQEALIRREEERRIQSKVDARVAKRMMEWRQKQNGEARLSTQAARAKAPARR